MSRFFVQEFPRRCCESKWQSAFDKFNRRDQLFCVVVVRHATLDGLPFPDTEQLADSIEPRCANRHGTSDSDLALKYERVTAATLLMISSPICSAPFPSPAAYPG